MAETTSRKEKVNFVVNFDARYLVLRLCVGLTVNQIPHLNCVKVGVGILWVIGLP